MSDTNQSLFHTDLNHPLLKLRRTKIVATLGPASNSPAMLEKLIRAGVDVFRVNFSHGKGEEHVQLMRLIREVAVRCKRDVAILGDLCGPKVRVGSFVAGAVTLKEGASVTITTADIQGTEHLIPSQYKGIVAETVEGARILLDDGNLELRVTRKSSDSLTAQVIRGGVLKNNKGMNLPDTDMGIPALTAKDKQDALYCIEGGADFVALSFVRRAQDVRDLRRWLKRHNANKAIISKIEKPEALEHISGILDESDGIMVARGDLGVELPATKVPHIQEKLIRLTNRWNKPVIVATQMLESMIEKSRPTRAEVTDVAGACRTGTDAVMMSAETAAGKYPLQSVNTMDAICREAEAHRFYAKGGDFTPARDDLDPFLPESRDLQDALCDAVTLLSQRLMVRAIFALTRSGYTARLLSTARPEAPVFALTHNPDCLHLLNLLWGVYPRLVEKELSPDEFVQFANMLARKEKLGRKGDYILLVSGSPGGTHLGTNAIQVYQVG